MSFPKQLITGVDPPGGGGGPKCLGFESFMGFVDYTAEVHQLILN